jgi:hypothetical protein
MGNDLITVCDKCFRASCWQGKSMCQESQTAGTVQKTRTELNSCYWKTDDELANE